MASNLHLFSFQNIAGNEWDLGDRVTGFFTAIIVFISSSAAALSFEEFKSLTNQWEVSSKYVIAANHKKDQRSIRSQIEHLSKLFIQQTIYEGIAKISAINPEVSDTMLAELGKNLTFNLSVPCGSPMSMCLAEHWNYSWGKYGLPFGSPVINFSFAIANGVLIAIGMDQHVAMQGATYTKEQAQSAIFHEILHFAHIENNSAKIHNVTHEWDHTKERDLVYACTAQAFPTLPILQEDAAERVLIEEKVMRLIIYYGNTTDACNICANAKKNAKGWRTSTDAHQACANVGPRNFPLKTRYDDDY